MIFTTAAAVVIVAVVVFRATRPTTATPNHTAARTNQAGHGAHHSRAAARRPTVAPTAHQLQVAAMLRQRKHYAARIVPVIDRSTRIFDGAARGATSANGNFNTLESACSYWGGKVQTSDAEYEGVPHPYVWWSPAGTLHHQVSGVFHYMLGAIQNCQESVQATDSGESSTAMSQMAAAAQNLHNQENYARYLATH